MGPAIVSAAASTVRIRSPSTLDGDRQKVIYIIEQDNILECIQSPISVILYLVVLIQSCS